MANQRMNWIDYVRKYSQYKLKETGKKGVTKEELKKLREEFSKGTKTEKTSLREAIAQYRNYKEKKTGKRDVSVDEVKRLKSLMETEENPSKNRVRDTASKGDFARLVENYRQYKSKALGKDSKVSYKEMKSLHEAFAKAKGRLREADQGFDPNAAVGGDPNAMPQDPNAAAAPGAPVDPTLVSQIQDVKNSVDALATAAGIQPDQMSGDPNAGVPAVTGQPPMDPGQQQMMESTVKEYRQYKFKKTGSGNVTKAEYEKLREAVIAQTQAEKPKSRIEKIRERIEARQTEMESLKEDSVQNAAQTVGRKTLSKLGGPQMRADFAPGDTTTDKAGTPSESPFAKVPSAEALAKGYSSGKGATAGNTWPTKAPKADKALQGKGADNTKAASTKVYEDTTEEKEGEQLQEASVTDKYIAKEMQPKLDFNSIKSALSSGLLG